MVMIRACLSIYYNEQITLSLCRPWIETDITQGVDPFRQTKSYSKYCTIPKRVVEMAFLVRCKGLLKVAFYTYIYLSKSLLLK